MEPRNLNPASVLPCLVDAMVLVDSACRGTLDALCDGERIAVAELVLASVTRWDGAGETQLIDLAGLVMDGRIEVVRATAAEVGAVMRWVGRAGLSDGELESVAIVLAGRGRLWTRDAVVRRALRELGIEDRSIVELGCE